MTTVALPADYYFAIGSTMEVDDGMAVDITDDGVANLRDLYANPQYVMNVKFTVLGTAQKNALLLFFQNNRTSDITFTLDGTNYIGKRTGKPQVGFNYGAGYSDISVTFRATEVV